MVKTLVIIRHAKAEQIFTTNDFERSLNERGKTDAPEMAKRLKKKLDIDAFVSSPAKRTKKTASYFCKAFDKNDEDIILVTALYQAPARTFFEVVADLDDSYKSVAIFAHNPGITNFANDLVPDAKIENMPTCSIVAVKAPITHWAEFENARKELLFFDYPKSN